MRRMKWYIRALLALLCLLLLCCGVAAAGDEVTLVGPDCEPFSWVAGSMQDMDGLPLTEPRTPQMRFRAKLPKQVPAMSFVRHAVELSGK